jgi:sirohydrochlorin cobaltochelatase
MKRGIVLFGHGSRDPAWRAPMDAVARRVAERAPDAVVTCAFLELQGPDLPTAIDQLVAGGVGALRVLPMFLGVGRHAREDLPVLLAQIRDKHPGLQLDVLPAVGEQPALLDLMAELALAR